MALCHQDIESGEAVGGGVGSVWGKLQAPPGNWGLGAESLGWQLQALGQRVLTRGPCGR